MRGVLAGLIVAFALACSGDGVTGSSTVTGAYALRTINGSPLPYTISGSGTNRTDVLQEIIEMYQGGTYARSRHSRITVNGQATEQTSTEGGSYTLLGTSVTLRNGSTGQEMFGTINGNTMTIVQAGMTAVFTK